MKAYFYQRIEDGARAKEWSYRLRNIPRDLPKAAWPDGFKKNGTLWTSKARTIEHVQRKIEETLAAAHEIRMGRLPADHGDIWTYLPRYLQWGRVQGGTRGEMGWAPDHADHIEGYIEEWIARLNIICPADIQQPAFRAEIVAMRAVEGLAPNTINHKARALTGFCKWMVEEKLLPTVPIRHKTLDRTPQEERGKFSMAEVGRLMAVAPADRALIYHTAYVTSYRKTAISKLRIGFIDWMVLTIGLHYLDNKNRRKTVKPLPPRLAEALYAACAGRGPEELVFPGFNPKQAVKRLRTDMHKAGVPLKDAAGRVRDFHSFKASFGSALDDLGTEPKVMQQALDHATFKQTLAYLKREIAPLRIAAESVEEGLFSETAKIPYHAGITAATPDLQPKEKA